MTRTFPERTVRSPAADPAEQELFDRAIAGERCRACNAKPGVLCASIIDASVYFERPHYTRLADARKRAAGAA